MNLMLHFLITIQTFQDTESSQNLANICISFSRMGDKNVTFSFTFKIVNAYYFLGSPKNSMEVKCGRSLPFFKLILLSMARVILLAIFLNGKEKKTYNCSIENEYSFS